MLWGGSLRPLHELTNDLAVGAPRFITSRPFKQYILDFVCFERRLVIEIDGSQHASSATDVARDHVLALEGFAVARYWNNDVLQRRTAVMEDILARLGAG